MQETGKRAQAGRSAVLLIRKNTALGVGVDFPYGVFLDIYCCSIWAVATADVSPLLQKHLCNVTRTLIDF